MPSQASRGLCSPRDLPALLAWRGHPPFLGVHASLWAHPWVGVCYRRWVSTEQGLEQMGLWYRDSSLGQASRQETLCHFGVGRDPRHICMCPGPASDAKDLLCPQLLLSWQPCCPWVRNLEQVQCWWGQEVSGQHTPGCLLLALFYLLSELLFVYLSMREREGGGRKLTCWFISQMPTGVGTGPY